MRASVATSQNPGQPELADFEHRRGERDENDQAEIR